MNNLEPWEKNIRDLSDNQKVSPPQFVWDNVEEAIREKKKRRFLFYWLFLAGLLAVGSGTFYLLNRANDKTIVDSDKIHNIENDNELNNEINKESNNLNQGVSKEIHSDIKKVNNFGNKHSSSTSTSKGSSDNFKNASNTYSYYKSNKSKLKSGIPITNIDSDKKIYNSNSKVTLREEINQRSNSSDNLTIVGNSSDYTKVQTKFPDFSKLSSNTGFLKYGIRPIIAIKYDNKDCPVFNKKNSIRFFAEAEGNYGIPIKSLSSTNDFIQLYETRKNSEETWYAWGGGIHLGLILNDKWSLSSGVDFSQIKEKFVTSRSGKVRVTINYDKDTGLPIDTIVEYGTWVTKYENRYSLINIPLIVGFEHRINNWGLGIDAGLDFNISLKSRGKIFDESQNILLLQEHNDIYKSRLGLGVHIALAVHRYINDKTSVYIKPFYKTYFNDWTQADYPVKTSFSNVGINLGIRYRF